MTEVTANLIFLSTGLSVLEHI
jgi:hypothetical protein